MLEPPAFGICTKERHDFSPSTGGASVTEVAASTASGVFVASAGAGIAGSGAETGGAGGRGASVGDDSDGLCGTSARCSPDVVPRKAPVCWTTTRQVFAREVKDTSETRKAPATRTKETQTTTRVRNEDGAARDSALALRRGFSCLCLARVSAIVWRLPPFFVSRSSWKHP